MTETCHFSTSNPASFHDGDYSCTRDSSSNSDMCIWHLPSEKKVPSEIESATEELNPGDVLIGADLRGLSLAGINFSQVNLSQSKFNSARLEKVSFKNCDLTSAEFRGLEMKGGELSECILDQAMFHQDFTRKKMEEEESETETGGSEIVTERIETMIKDVEIKQGQRHQTELNLNNSTFRECRIDGFRLDHPKMVGVDFQSGQINRLDVTGGTISVHFRNAEVTNPKFRELTDGEIEFEYKSITDGLFEFTDNGSGENSNLLLKHLSDSSVTAAVSSTSDSIEIISCDESDFIIDSKSVEANMDSIFFSDLKSGCSIDITDININSLEIIGSDLHNLTTDRINIKKAELDGVKTVNRVHLSDTCLEDGTISGCEFTESEFDNLILNNIELYKSTFAESEFKLSEFRDINAEGIEFSECIFDRCKFVRSKLRGSQFVDATFQDKQTIRDVSFRRGDFTGTELKDQDLNSVDFESTTFLRTDIRGSSLAGAAVHDMQFDSARINENTDLGRVCAYELMADRNKEENPSISIEDIDWVERERSIIERNRRATARAGLRRLISRLRSSSDKDELKKAIRVYRAYQNLLRANSLMKYYTEYRIRERHAQRKLAISTGNYFQWVRLELSRVTMLYGESPWRVIGFSGLIVAVWSILYRLSGAVIDTTQADGHAASSLAESLYFSIVTFTTLGYGDLQPQTTVVRFLSGAEAILGAIFTALLVSVLVRRATQ